MSDHQRERFFQPILRLDPSAVTLTRPPERSAQRVTDRRAQHCREKLLRQENFLKARRLDDSSHGSDVRNARLLLAISETMRRTIFMA